MAEARIDGTTLYYERHGSGDPLALVHGSWVDANSWAFVVPGLAGRFEVLVYDRRGHSRSERPDSQGSVEEDGDDLAGLLEALELAPAHVVTNSYGGNVALRLACRRPELFRSLSCHEPPLWGVLADDPGTRELLEEGGRSIEAVRRQLEAGEHEGAAHQFVDEVAFGPGAWETQMPPELRELFVRNAPTFLDELRDPHQLTVDEEVLARLAVPVRLTEGTDSPPTFSRVIDRLVELIPNVSRERFEGAGHVPQLTHAELFVETTTRALQPQPPAL